MTVQAKKTPLPYEVWNAGVEFTGHGMLAKSSDATKELRVLRKELGKVFDIEFRRRMALARADTFSQLIQEWVRERKTLGV